METTLLVGEHSFRRLASLGVDALDGFIDLIDLAAEHATVLAWEDVFEVPVDGFESLSDFLFGPEAFFDRDVRLLAGSRLQRLGSWGAADGSPEYEWTDGQVVADFAPSIGLGVLRAADSPWGCLCINDGEYFGGHCRIRAVGTASDDRQHWFVTSPQQLRDFWRYSLIRYSASPDDVAASAPAAFPTTQFATRIWSQLDRFEGVWREVRDRLVQVLAGLDDGAVQVFAEHHQNHVRAATLAAAFDVNCSPESPNTHANSAAMAQREAIFDDGTKTCEWHAKLEPHRNRVHFHVEGGRLYVGVFAKHLTI